MYRPSPGLEAILRSAARDYLWLLDRDYSTSAALKLVGDRFQLPSEERMILFRGVVPSRDAAVRRLLLAASARDRGLLVDGYNQGLAVMHYLEGRPVFLASDGLLRDAGGSHGRIARPELFDRALGLLAERVAAEGPSSVLAFFDAPVPKSASHARFFREKLASLGMKAEARIEADADPPLKRAPAGSLVATSDSAIADALAARPAQEGMGLFDAARAAIEALRAGSRPGGADTPWLDISQLLECSD